MAEVLAKPQFQIFTHIKTGAKVGRIYFPALFLAEFHATVYQWLQRQEIIFDDKDIKQYVDGSLRLYFRSANSLETEYFQLVKPFRIQKHQSYFENKFPDSTSVERNQVPSKFIKLQS